MSRISEFIKNHEVLSFFVLTYIIAWGSFTLLVPFAGVLVTDGQIQILAVPRARMHAPDFFQTDVASAASHYALTLTSTIFFQRQLESLVGWMD